MIVSKPQTSTVISFVIFLTLTFVVLAMNILVIIKDPQPAWYTYLIIAILIPIALFVLYKIFIRYKIIRLGNNMVELAYPVLRQTKKYSLDQIEYWVEHQVKTGKNSTYKETEIKFMDGIKLTIGHKEHTEYGRIVQYLSLKAAKKKRSDA
jgi:hypothetical protein